ncbi:glycosyltransferase [Candidatus Kaiserbacteria bacterium]|nr:glycosyltransferase [Candidatus Kaiserbacteria bacterium]
MKVLMITGDKKFGPGHPRYDLQASVCDLSVVYWGRGSVFPKIPPGPFGVVTSQDPFWRGLFAWWVARRIGAKLNIQVHTSVLNALGKFVLRRADSVRVVSEKIRQHIVAIGIRAPITVLPIYVDVSKFRTITPQPHGQKTILWVGRFEDEKDPLLALNVLEAVRQEGVDAALVMLGTGSLEKSLTARAKGLPVQFPGWRDPAAYLAQADVVLSTSKHESYGASIIEALAAGVAVVAPDVGVAREAGAIVVPRSDLGHATAAALRAGARGELKLALLDPEEWVKRWCGSLQ